MRDNWNDYKRGEDKQDWEISSSILSFLRENKWQNHMKNKKKSSWYVPFFFFFLAIS